MPKPLIDFLLGYVDHLDKQIVFILSIFSWNFSQGPLLGFPLSGQTMFGGLITQQHIGPAWLTGGAYGPEAGIVGMIFRFVIMVMVIYYLQWRCNG